MINNVKSTSSRIGKYASLALARTTCWASIATLALATIAQPLAVSTSQAQSTSRNHIRITAAEAQTPQRIRLGLDKSLVVDLPADAHDILVANPEVADAVTRTSRRIYLFGKEIGQTNIFVFDGAGNQVAAMEISIERDIAGLQETLARLIPNSDIQVEMISDNIVLTGTVPNPQSAAKAVSLAEIFVKGGEQTQGGNQGNSLAALFGDEPESQTVNLLKIQGEDQVHLKVTVAEVSRSVIKQLGITTTANNPGSDGFGFTARAGGVFQQIAAATLGGSVSLNHGLNSITGQLQALESAGVMRTLAEPSLTAISGEEANFNVGGRVQQPQDIENEENGVAIRYDTLEYGISLSFKPVVLTEGRISLKINTEVKEPTIQGSSTFNARANLPGIRHRQADTTVELPSGGSMVIAGLIQDDVRQVVSGHPGLKNIPVLGSLFRSREFIRNESEVMIVVTPYLVRPTARKQIAQPDENFMPASDAAGYFMGRINRVYGTKQGNLPKGRYTGSIGFILK
ncbi:MAG: type II and III secretion system protein family protein [Pseudomonadota bacterium]